MLWEPVNALVLLEHQLLATFNIEEPAWESAVHNTLFTAWIEWVFMFNIFNFPDHALFFEALRNKLIAGPNLDTILICIADANLVQLLCPFWIVVTVIVNRMAYWHLIALTERIVIFTISRRDMYDTRTILVAYKISDMNFMGIFVFANLIIHFKKWQILQTLQVASRIRFKGLHVLSKQFFGQFRGHNHLLAIYVVEPVF